MQTETLTRVSRAGYEFIEMHFHHRPQWVADEFAKLLHELNLTPYSIHLPKFLLSVPDEEFQNDVESIFSLGKKLEVKVSVLHPPFVGQLREDEWKRRMEILFDVSEESNILLTLELIPYLRNPDLFIREQIHFNPHRKLGVTLDIEYMFLNELKMEWMIDSFGDKIVNVHFRDSDGKLLTEDGKRKYLNPGEGKVDLLGMLRALHTADYEGALTVEVSHRDPSNIIEAKEYAERCLEELGLEKKGEE